MPSRSSQGDIAGTTRTDGGVNAGTTRTDGSVNAGTARTDGGVKSGTRALGVAESYTGSEGDLSTLAGVVTRADRTTDGFAFASCTVSGLDATDAVCDLYDALGREDVRYVFLSGVAPAWYNLIDLDAIHAHVDRPVLAVTYESSSGLEPGLRDTFTGTALETRLERYDRLPERTAVSVNDQTVFVRVVGLDSETAAGLVRAFTPEGGRPEPLRVARLAARAADDWRQGDRE